MKRRFGFLLFSVVLLSSMILAACQGGAGGGAAPAATTLPMTYEEIKFAPEKVEAPDCDYGGVFKSIEAVDESTIKFTLCYPDPDFASKVAFSAFAIADKGFLNLHGGDSVKMSEQPVGTGPYIVKEWVRGDHITYEANPNYWGEKAKVKTLIFRWSEQPAQRKLELDAGTVDGIDNPAPEDFDAIASDSKLKLYDRAALNIFYLGFNHDKAPFDNIKVRQAFAMAIDRQRIVDQYYPKTSTVADVFVPPSIKPGYSDIKWYDYDPEAAKALLAEAGYPNGLEVTLSFRNVVRSYLATPDKVAQEIQAQLAEIGVTVKLEQMESAAFNDAAAAGELAFYILGWNADYPGATNFYDYHFATENNMQSGSIMPEIADEIRAAAKLSDPVERQKHYDKVNQLIKDLAYTIPVAHGGSATAFKAEVTGAHASPLGNEIFSVMDNKSDKFVWMQNGEPASLWCSDETDGETLRACEQTYEALLSYKVGGTEVEPGLAEKWSANADATEWVFTLRKGVKFQNGATLDAGDVLASYVAQWDASSPNHKGRTGNFEYFGAFFGAFLNAPK